MFGLHLAGMGSGLVSASKGGFSLAAYMASLSDGFWYDFGQTDRLFQENVGPTPANDPNEVIGLALSSRLWGGRTFAEELAQATEIVPTGAWTPLSDAILTSQTDQGFRIQSGAADAVAASQKSFSGFVVGRSYRIVATADVAAADSTILRVGAAVVSGTGSIVEATRSGTGVKTWELFFTATATTLFFGAAAVRAAFNADATFSGFSIKEVSRYPATQATGSFKPTFQTTGAKFDGSDDRLQTGYTAGSGSNFIVARVTIPATVAAYQNIAGLAGSGSTERFAFGVNTDGRIGFAVGPGSPTAIKGTTDLRGLTAVIGLSCDGSNIRGFVGSSQEYTGAQTGLPSTTVPVFLGCLNVNSSPGNYFGGTIHSIVAGKASDASAYIDPARFNQIASQL